jgi:hypothetical protein
LEPLGITEEDRVVATTNASMGGGVNLSGTAAIGLLHATSTNDLDDAMFLEAYHTFWSKLTTPECTALVQSMRAFLRNLENTITAHWNNHGKNTSNHDGMVERVATSLRTYIESALDNIQAHPAWKRQELEEGETVTANENAAIQVRRSLESFLYGHCSNLLEKIMWDTKANEEEDIWMKRISSLQFIQAKHLELECLSDKNLDSKSNTLLEYQLLQRPIQILQSVDCYYSPFEKLQRILAVYRSVNAALSEALNRHDESSSPKTLPSADDVLPTLILTVLRAKPKRILWNLRMIEAFSRPEYLRGEAGYAYTNLYGAIQFLQDIDLTNVEQSSTSLSIPPEEFRQGLETCRKAAEERIQANLSSSANKKSSALFVINENRPQLSVQAVRQARLGGETINVEWATRWQEDQERISATKSSAAAPPQHSSSDPFQLDLPATASRTYSFLSTRPEDVRVADLPRLLSEYRMLVHSTERLLAERTSEAISARRKKITQQKNTLLAKAEAVESGMLKKTSNSNNMPREM